MSSQGQDLARVMGCMPISGTDSHRAQNKNFCASYPIVLRVPTLLHLTTVAMDCHTTKQTKNSLAESSVCSTCRLLLSVCRSYCTEQSGFKAVAYVNYHVLHSRNVKETRKTGGTVEKPA